MPHHPISSVPETEQGEFEKKALASWRRHDLEHSLPDTLLDLIAARFRLLGEPLRLKLLSALVDGERSVGELVAMTGAGQSNVSKHLAALAEGGVVRRRKVGTSTLYTIADPLVLTLCDMVCAGLHEHFATQVRTFEWNKNE